MTVRNAASMETYGAEWSVGGYAGKGNVVGLLNSLLGRPAIVAGGADGVFDQVADAAKILGDDSVIFAANDVGMYLPKLDHWVSLHAHNLAVWKATRWLHPAEKEDVKYHSIDKSACVDYVWKALTPCFVLSGYFAMQVAWLMGCRPIVLCGCPGDYTRRFFEAGPRTDGFTYDEKGVREQIEKEMTRIPQFKTAVRSMSGWTKEFFGGL